MTSKRTAMAFAAVALFLAACSQTDGDATATAATQTTASSSGVAFEARPDIQEGVQALPRLVGDTPAIAAINADLDRFDAAAGREVCGGPGTVERAVAQPMTGPAYVSFRISQYISCEGAAHPSIGQIGMTYDLSTGQRVDWAAALPGLELGTIDFDGEGDGQVVLPAQYQSTALARWYGARMLAEPNAEWVEQCRSVFELESLAERSFNIWADAEVGGVVVSPDLPHVVMACGEPAVLSAQELQRWGAPPALVAAIGEARAAGAWAPKAAGA